MKNILFLCLALLGLGQIANAQSNWKVGKVGFFLSGSAEAYQASSFDDILNMAKNKDEVIRDLSKFDGNLTAHVGGGFAGFQFLLTPPKANRALLINASLSTGREMLVSQQLRDGANDQITNPVIDGFTGYPQFEEATYCIVENELKVDAAWLHYKNLGARFKIYGGFGASLGGTFNNDFIVMGTEKIEPVNGEPVQFRNLEGTYESKNTFTGRAFAYGGLSFQFARHFELALDAQQGVGVQKAVAGPTNFLHSSTLLNLGLRYVL